MALTFFFNSPLEQFQVVSLLSLNGVNTSLLSFTNHGFYTLVVLFLIIGLHVISNNEYRLIPSSWSVAMESSYATVNGIVRGQIGANHEVFIPLIYSLFWFVLLSNLVGNVPYSYTTTTSIMTSLGLSIVIWVAVTTIALSIHGVHFFSFFVPSGTPLPLVPMLVLIELVSYVARAISLGLRAWANMVAGHTLLKILATFLGQLFTNSILVAVLTLIPFAVFIALIGLEIAVSFIQAYVFAVLTSSYLKDAIELH